MTISALYLYPIKSLSGIAVTEAVVEPKGFRYDRRFMLVSPGENPETDDWVFITQRINHQMALIDVSIAGDTLRVWHQHRPDDVLELPLVVGSNASDETLRVSIWDSKNVPAKAVSAEADRWFSAALGNPCRLVFMPETTHRAVDPQYARQDDAVSFADGYPYLLIGQASLDHLNQRLAQPIEINRFRPNIVVSGSEPNEEDSWQEFRVGKLHFYGVKPCARCVLTTIDPATGQKGLEPLRTLATYRQWKHKILFGQNVLSELAASNASTPGESTPGILRVGQPIDVIRRTEPWLAPPKAFTGTVLNS
ncbi:MOSC domain-containing protein [Spirosoma taeanense]|uniref:MOSC domain-containing protein n=1 Tax=Spirosoma taeanense TaxID=2735870 RepID=A0A6M5Y651_9BACT|nr:MOSC N-terminal beta barrel domain-containing protein [Spirosoma taeanense]QJW88944.1 MOSC domain-containing protein [Spirosoma taeanense]